MSRVFLLSMALTAFAVVPPSVRSENVVTLNGWFSDKDCAAAKMQGETITPNGTACVKKCLDGGATPVFVDPKGREMYEVKEHAALKDDVGYYLELTGVVDAKAKTIEVRSVKRLGDVVQMCARPVKK
jgi:hypothetical protein